VDSLLCDSHCAERKVTETMLNLCGQKCRMSDVRLVTTNAVRYHEWNRVARDTTQSWTDDVTELYNNDLSTLQRTRKSQSQVVTCGVMSTPTGTESTKLTAMAMVMVKVRTYNTSVQAFNQPLVVQGIAGGGGIWRARGDRALNRRRYRLMHSF